MWAAPGSPGSIIPAEAESDITDVVFASRAALALKSDGTLISWQTPYIGELDIPPEARSDVKAIAAGEYHFVALKTDGHVVAWLPYGPYSASQNGTIVPAGLSNVTAIAAGRGFSVALNTDGGIVAWGDLRTNTPPEFQTGITAIAAGTEIICLKRDGTVAPFPYSSSPVPNGLTGVTAISHGDYWTMALKSNGEVVVWGSDHWHRGLSAVTNIPINARSEVIAIAAGQRKAAVIKADGTIVSWGEYLLETVGLVPPATLNGTIKISMGRAVPTSAFIVRVTPPDSFISQPTSTVAKVGEYVEFTATATGFPHRYQWLRDGVPIIAATNVYYRFLVTDTNQSGHYSVAVSNHLGRIESQAAVLAAKEAVGGTLIAWPSQYKPAPTQYSLPPPGLAGVVASSGIYALLNNGSVVSWFDHIALRPNKITLAAKSGVTAIASGWFHLLALKNDGTVLAWGDSPATNAPPGLSSVVAIAAGNDVSAALRQDGTLLIWGGTFNGQTSVPEHIQGKVASVAIGGEHVLALLRDGTLIAWGKNNSGQVDIPAEAQAGIRAISAGGIHSVAVKEDGRVVAWGHNFHGQCNVPPELSDVQAVAAGSSMTAALKKDGTVVVWGEIRSPDYTLNYIPATVPEGLHNVTAISCWGDKFIAILGDGTYQGLQVSPFGSRVILTWPTNFVDAVLQSATSLTPPVSWENWPASPSAIGKQFSITNQVSKDKNFFRLYRTQD